MSVMCRAVHVSLPTLGESVLPGPLARHIETCVPCRGEVARYRTMHRELDAMAVTIQRAPVGLTNDVLASLRPLAVVSEPAKRDNRGPVTAAAVVVTAAAGTAALYRLYRHRAA